MISEETFTFSAPFVPFSTASALTWQAMTLALASALSETTRSLASLRMEPAFLQLKIRCESKTKTYVRGRVRAEGV